MKAKLFIFAVFATCVVGAALPTILSPSASAQATSVIIFITQGTLPANGQYVQSSGDFFRLVSGTPVPTPTPGPEPCVPAPGSPGGFIYFGGYTLSNSETGNFFLTVENVMSRPAFGIGSPVVSPPNPTIIEQGPAVTALQINPFTGMGTGTVRFTSNGGLITGTIIIEFGIPTPPTEPVVCGGTPTPTPAVTPTPVRTPTPNPSPTPAGFEITGRVTTPANLSLRNAIVSLTDSLGVRRTATTSSFGVYTFTGVRSGESYTIGVSSKRYRFTPINVMVNGNLANVNFTGLE